MSVVIDRAVVDSSVAGFEAGTRFEDGRRGDMPRQTAIEPPSGQLAGVSAYADRIKRLAAHAGKAAPSRQLELTRIIAITAMRMERAAREAVALEAVRKEAGLVLQTCSEEEAIIKSPSSTDRDRSTSYRTIVDRLQWFTTQLHVLHGGDTAQMERSKEMIAATRDEVAAIYRRAQDAADRSREDSMELQWV